MYFKRPTGCRRLKNPNAVDTTRANNTIPSKCVSFIAPAQAFRPRAVSYACNAASRFSTPAVAMNRVP